MVVSVGLPLRHVGAIYNVAALVADGRLLGFVGKQNLAGDGLHYEPRWFKPWPHATQAVYSLHEQPIPIGDLIFDIGGVRIGFEICEDAWVANRPGAELSVHGVDIVLNPSASHFAFDKHEVRKRFVLEGSRAFSVCYVYANLLGNEAGRSIYDGDAMIASGGRMLAKGPRFAYADAVVTTAVADIDENRLAKSRTSSLFPVVRFAPGSVVISQFTWPDRSVVATNRTAAPVPLETGDAWESSEHHKEEEFTRAIALGLFDYLRKSRSRGYVVSLSGGADSAAVAILASLSVQWPHAELGPEAWWKKLEHIPGLQPDTDLPTAVSQLLLCAYQSTRNSGDVTRQAARDVASVIQANFLELDVDDIVEDYVNLVSAAIGRPLSWDADDLALQNIQARSRGPSIWMLANVRGALLLATSNRSEAAVGYATMDGDTCGGLSPIAGIDKAFLRQWLSWMENHGPTGSPAWPALSAVNQQQPTAELRPQAAGQTDEQDLMPYELLDAIERAAIRDKHAPLEVYQLMHEAFPEYRHNLGVWVERFFQLWCRNQWKRERYAPSFHVDDKNLDPKTWCRFPILSGGYRRELERLRRFLDAN